MTAVTFLWFVGVLALASMSEARLYRSQVPGSSEGPKVQYNWTTAEATYNQISDDKAHGYLVWSELPDRKLQEMITSLQGMLRIFPRTVMDPLFLMNMTNVTIPRLEIPQSQFKVVHINLIREPSSVLLQLTIVVPKILVTFNSLACQKRGTPIQACHVSYEFGDVAVALKTKWQNDSQLQRISNAVILDCYPTSIEAILRVKNGRIAWISTSEGERAWEMVRAKVKSHIPDRNPNYQELVRTFGRTVFL